MIDKQLFDPFTRKLAPTAAPRVLPPSPRMPPTNRTPTSRAAAESITRIVGTLRGEVLAHIVAQGERGATCYEVLTALGLRPQTASARCNELTNLGLIDRGGETRPTDSGRQAAVYVATQAGREAAP